MEAIGNGRKQSPEAALLRCLYQTEIERLKYIFQSYLVARIRKIERLCYWLQELPKTDLIRLLSVSEVEHLNRFLKITDEALERAVLARLPEALRAYPTEEEQTVMPEPNMDEHVIVRMKTAIESLLIEPL